MSTPPGIPLFIIGGGDHARVIAEAARLLGYVPRFILPDDSGAPDSLSEKQALAQLASGNGDTAIICGIGSTGDMRIRETALVKFSAFEASFVKIVHPTACISGSAYVGRGSFVAQGAILGVQAQIQPHAIINTGAIVDHDSIIGEGSHVAPGAAISGRVSIGKYVHVGTGTTIIQGVKVADRVVLGAGCVLTRAIEIEGSTWVGVPAKPVSPRLKAN